MDELERRRRGPLTWFTALWGTNWAPATVGAGLLLFGAVFLQFTPIILLREKLLVPHMPRRTAQSVFDLLAFFALAVTGLGIAMLILVAYRLVRDAVISSVRRK